MEKKNLIDAISKMSNEEYTNFCEAIEAIWTTSLADLPVIKEESHQERKDVYEYDYTLENISEDVIEEFCKNRKSPDKCTHNQKISECDFFEYANERISKALNDDVLINIMNKL